MRTFDPTPFWRSTVGFDRLFDLMDQSSRWTEDHYPPYNIERVSDDHYAITLALAGFSPDEITITAEQNVLTVEGSKGQSRMASTSTRASRPARSGARSTWRTMSR